MVALGIDVFRKADNLLRTCYNAEPTAFAIIGVNRHSWHGCAPFCVSFFTVFIIIIMRVFCQTFSLPHLFQSPQNAMAIPPIFMFFISSIRSSCVTYLFLDQIHTLLSNFTPQICPNSPGAISLLHNTLQNKMRFLA